MQRQKEDKLKITNLAHCSLKSGFFKRCTTSSNEPSKQTTKKPSSTELCSEPSSSSAVAASSILFKPSTSNLKILGQFFDNIEQKLSRIIPKLENEELLLSVLKDAAKVYNGIEKQVSLVINSGIRKPKQKISQLQIDIRELEQRLIDLRSSLKIFSNVSIDSKFDTLALQKEVLKRHEAINTCFLNARKIMEHIKVFKLLYSLSRRVKDTHREKAQSNKTPALTKSGNMSI